MEILWGEEVFRGVLRCFCRRIGVFRGVEKILYIRGTGDYGGLEPLDLEKENDLFSRGWGIRFENFLKTFRVFVAGLCTIYFNLV